MLCDFKVPFHSSNQEANFIKAIMSRIEKQYSQNHFMGASIKCGESFPSLNKIIEALYVMVYGCTEVYARQRGYHVRLRFTKKMNSRKFSARFSNFFKRKSGYTPIRLTVVEQDVNEGGVHYHYAVILNEQLDRKSSLQHFMGKLMAGGFLTDYKVISPDIDAYGHHLQTLEERDSYFEWMSYLAKVATKAETGQVWSPCRNISHALAKWRLSGKPDLRKLLFDNSQKDTVATVGVFELMQLVDVQPTVVVPRTVPSASHGAF